MPEEGPGYLGVDETVTHDEDMEQALTQATTVLQSTWETGNRIKIIVVAGVKSSKKKKKFAVKFFAELVAQSVMLATDMRGQL